MLLAACGSDSHRSTTESAPPVPEVKLDAFQPTIRAEIETAYQAARAAPDDPAAVGELAMLLHAHQQNATAATCYDRARILEPGKFDWVYLLATVEAEQGKDEPAMRHLRRALEIDPSYVPAQLTLAGLLLKTGSTEAAGKLYRSVLEADPNSAIAWYGLGRVQSVKGDTAGSAVSYQKAVDLYPNYGQAHYALALAYRRLKQSGKAKEHFRLGEKHKLEMPPTGDRVLTAVRGRTKSPTEFLRAGVELDKQGRLEESLAIHLEVLKIDPNQVQAHINLISLYARLGQVDKALEHYRAALKLNKNLPDCHYNYGVLMFSQKKYKEAREAFERAVEINPFYAKAHNNLGTMLEMEGKLDAAAAEFRKAIENQPGYRLARFQLGKILVNQGRIEEAIREFSQIIAPADAQTPDYLYALGIAYARGHDRAQALKYMRQAKQEASRYDRWELLTSISRDLDTLEGRRAQR